jgi:hypothetical protein
MFKSFFSPSVPINRIMRVLQQVRTGLVDQSVGEFGLSIAVFGHRDPFVMDTLAATTQNEFAPSLASSVLGL